jgi:hypothetical protein
MEGFKKQRETATEAKTTRREDLRKQSSRRLQVNKL